MISTKGRYALRIMLDLANQKKGEYISLKDISLRQEVSLKYLESIISVLNKASYVESSRGKSGGYRLTKEPFEYCIGDIIRLIEGPTCSVKCLNGDFVCKRKKDCLTLPFWQGLDKVINDYFNSYTLQDLLRKDDKIYCI